MRTELRYPEAGFRWSLRPNDWGSVYGTEIIGHIGKRETSTSIISDLKFQYRTYPFHLQDLILFDTTLTFSKKLCYLIKIQDLVHSFHKILFESSRSYSVYWFCRTLFGTFTWPHRIVLNLSKITVKTVVTGVLTTIFWLLPSATGMSLP